MSVHLVDDIVQIVNAKASPRRDAVLPIFRSEAQYRVLGELYTSPGLETTIGDLAERTDIPHPTVSREVKRLAHAGLIRTRARGRQTLVSADTATPVYEDLRNLLSKVYGVLPVLADAFAGVADKLLVFGSWAARWRGEPGPQPRDIDVLVLTDVPARHVWDAAADVSRQLGMDVNVVVRTAAAWETDETGFASELRRRPSVEIHTAPMKTPPPRPRDDDVTSQSDRRWG